MPDTQPVNALKTRIYLKQRRLSRAQSWVQACGLSVNDDLTYLREFEHMTLARVLAAEYQSTGEERKVLESLRLLERLLRAAEEGKRIGSAIEILIVQALAHSARGNRARALESLKRALQLAEPEGYLRIFLDEGQAIADLLPEVGEVEGSKEYLHRLLSAFEEKSDDSSSSPAQPLIEPLSRRELEVLRLVARGLSNDQISKRLFLSVNTVKGHNLRLFNKLQAKSRTEAVARARELGLL